MCLFLSTSVDFDDGDVVLGVISYSHIPSTCRSMTLQRFFAVLWMSSFGDPAGNSLFGLIRRGRNGFITVWRRATGVDLPDLVVIVMVL